MASKFIIRFYPSSVEKPDLVDWLLTGSDGAIVASGHSLLADIPKLPETCWVAVLVPSAEVLSFQITLPKMKTARLRKMTPFAIEEFLAVDLAEVHLAISSFQSNGKFSIGVVQHELMKSWLQKLKEAGIHADVMVPDFWYLPWKEGSWSIWIESSFAWVKTDENQGFFSDIQNLPLLIDLKLKEFEKEGKPLLEKIEVIFSPGQYQENLVQEIRNKLNFQIDASVSSRDLLSLISSCIPEKQTFNLLQPPYEVKRKWGKLKKQWFPVALLLAVWLGLFLFRELFEYFYLKRQNKLLEQQTHSLYQQVFPLIKDNNASKEQLKQLLEQTIKVARGDAFFKQLSQVAPLIKSSSVTLTGFNYRDQVLTLKIKAQDFQALNGLLQLFKQQGILVDQKHTAQQKDSVVSEWVIKK